MAHDAARGVTVLFGGTGDGSTALGDTWKWNGVSWIKASPIGPTPPGRWGHAMAYDSVRQVVVLFGGWSGQAVLGDTWEWNGAAWTQITPSGSAPPARDDHAMAFDAARGVVVLFGGEVYGVQGHPVLNDMWTWNGSVWTQVPTTGPWPSERYGHGLAFDSARNVTVLFGGLGTSGVLTNTWEWDGISHSWQQRTLVGPSAGEGIAMTYDPGLGRTVAFGGSHNNSQTWVWDGNVWSSMSLSGPSGRKYHSMTYDAGRHVITLFGGFSPYLGDTWELANVDDCNFNGIPDDLDVVDGYSPDCNHDYVPDECDQPPCSRPDLVVTVVSPPAAGVAGQFADILYTIRNANPAAAVGTCTDRIYFSTDNQIGNDTSAESFQYNINLGPGESLNRVVTVRLPGQAGLKYVVVSTNATGSVDEGVNTANNATISGSAIDVQAIPQPDLEVTSVTPPSDNIVSGSTTQVTWTVRNNGTGSTSSAQWVDQILVSNNPDLGFGGNGGDAALCGDPHVSFAAYVNNPEYLGVGNSYSQTATITLPRNVRDNFYVYAIADRPGCGHVMGDVAELNDTNNLRRSGPFVVTLQPQPDLTPIDISHFPVAQTGQYFTVSWVDRNAGHGRTDVGTWVDAVYLSTNNNPTTVGDHKLGQRTRSGPALNAETSDPVVSVTGLLPTTLIDGDYYVKVAVDVTFQIPELETPDNNVQISASPVNISQSPRVNLAVIQPPSVVTFGAPAHPITVNYQAGNIGAPPTIGYSWKDRVYLSTDATLNLGTDIYLGIFPRATSYANGAFDLSNYDGQVQAALPRNLAPGNYHVLVVLDGDDEVDEGPDDGPDETNNVVPSSTFAVQWVPTDLTIAQIAPTPPSAAAGQSFSIAWQVSNTGTAVTPVAHWVDAVYLSSDNVLDSGDTVILTMGHSGAVAAGGAYSEQGLATIPVSRNPGNYFLILLTDRHDDVYEQAPGEGNNVNPAPIPFVVTPANITYVADIQPSAPVVPGTIQPGQTFGVSYTVTNIGNIATTATTWVDRLYLSTDAQLGTDDVLLDTATHVGALDALADYPASRSVTVPTSTVPGSYYLIVQVDAAGQVFEASESNNTRAATTSVPGSPPSAANLQVTAVSADANGVPGQPLSVTWTVTNAGNAPTPVALWRDSVYLSNDPIPGNDLFLGHFQQSAGLGIGQSRATTAPFVVPCNAAGAYYLIVVADSGNAVPELNREGDNAGASAAATQIVASALPNLRVTTITAPASAVSGQSVDITWTPRNAGGATCYTDWSDGVFLSRDTILDLNGDEFLGAYAHAAALPTGDAVPITRSFAVPPGLSGPYFVIVRADYLNQLAESVEIDNDGVSNQLLQIGLPQPCDLRVTDVSAGGSYLLGEVANFQWQVTNASDVPVTGVWSDSVYLSADDTWDISDVLVGRIVNQPTTLNAHGSITRNRTEELPAVRLPGNYHVIVKTDVMNQILETDNANNTMVSTSTLAIGVQPLQLGVPFNGPLAAGASRYFALTVPAGETVRIQMTHTSPTAWTELFVRKNQIATPADFDLTVDRPDQPNQTITIPTTEATTYYILARATAGTFSPGDDQMTIVANIVPFAVDSVQPRNAGNGDRVTLRIAGSRFSPGTTVALLGPGNQVLTPASVTWLDGQNLRARFDLTGATFGPYDVRVMESGGDQAVLNGAIVVEPARPIAATVSASGSLLPRADGAFQANAMIVNTSNVDAPMVTVMARFDGDVRIGWNRPADSLPRPADVDIPGYDWRQRSPTAVFNDGRTMDMFHLRDVSPGEAIPVSALVTRLSAGEFQFVFGVHAGTRAEFASSVFGMLESARQSLVNTNTSALAPDLRAVLLDPAGWRAYFQDALAEYDLIDPGEFPAVSLTCNNFWPCASSVAVGALMAEIFECGLLPTPPANLCRLIKALHLVHGGLECYHHHCSLQCETCVDGRYEWGACSFVDVIGSYFTSMTQGCGRAQNAIDPNEKIGPTGGSGGSGGGGLQLIAGNTLNYEVHFENLPTATATVNTVTITDDLDPALNPGSVRLGAVRIGDVTLTQLQNRIFYQEQIDLRPGKDVLLNVTAGVNATARQAFWILETIDPNTGVRPSDPNRGILPPEDGSGRGKGFIAFAVSPSPGAGTGAPVRNGAKITFDNEPSIYTNVVENFLDMDRPISTVIPTPPLSDVGTIPLTWVGLDQQGGSSLRDFTIYAYSRTSPLTQFNAALAAPAPNLINVTAQSGQFTGLPGRQYGFFSIARDTAGNLELPPAEPDAVTWIPLDPPGAAAAGFRSGVTVELLLGLNSPAIRNAIDTEYAVVETGGNRYLQIDGRLGSTPVWRTPAKWGPATTIRALQSTTAYSFALVARNGFGQSPVGPAIAVVTRNRGDVNGDGQVNAADIALVQQILGTVYGQPNFNAAADVNGDDAVSAADLTIVSAAQSCLFAGTGDFNGDGMTNAQDVPGLISSLFNPTTTGNCVGDMNFDLKFNGLDVQLFVRSVH